MQHIDNYYKVFAEDRALIFSTSAAEEMAENIIDFRTKDTRKLFEVFREFTGGNTPLVMLLVSEDPGQLFEKFSEYFVLIEAAGGLVKNQKGELLVIYRWQKWDLPKGKTDKGEKPQKAAIREVTEECGLNKLHITGSLPHTFHAYPLGNDKWALKKTYWYNMVSNDSSPPIPQLEEGIEKTCWIRPSQLPMILENTYPSLKELFIYGLKETQN